MKHCIALFCALILINTPLLGYEFHNDNVQFDEYEKSIIEDLSKELYQYHDKNYKDLPKELRAAIEKPGFTNYFELPEELGERFQFYLMSGENLRVHFGKLYRWCKIHSDDGAWIMWESLLDYINKRDFELDAQIAKHMLIYRENTHPEFALSPNGQGKIHWAWRLPTDKRKYGIIHVGIDEKKRTFLCYECGVGIYFPEGDVMERIYTEIVQDPDSAGIWLGKGRLEYNKDAKKGK